MDWGQTTLLHGLGSDHINVWTGYLYMESKGEKGQEHTHNNVCSYSLRLLELYKLVLKVVLIYPSSLYTKTVPRRYLSSQYLADSSLGADISQYDFSTGTQVPHTQYGLALTSPSCL